MVRKNPIDAHVGRRLAQQMKLLGYRPEHIAADLGLSVADLTLRIRGEQRFGAMTLYLASQRLRVPVHYFYEGLAHEAEATSIKHEGSATSDGEQGDELEINATTNRGRTSEPV